MAEVADGNAEARAFKALTAIVDPWLTPTDNRFSEPLQSVSLPDWPSLLACARRHRVIPLLARRIFAMQANSGADFALPADIAEGLQREARSATISELAMLGEIRRLKALFGGMDIPFLLVKGLALSQRCFGGPGWRVNNDIDVLIRPEDMPRAHAMLCASQYDRVQPAGELSDEEVAADLKRRKDWVYVKRQDRIILELHHRLFDNARLCAPGVMDRAERLILFDQVEIATLGSEDELPYLALHGAMHAWSRLKWLIDFAILLRERSSGEIDAMLRQAQGGPAANALHQAIALCWRLFEPATEEPRILRPRRTRILAAAGIRAMSGEGSEELEDTRLGTTIKSASHYLLWSNPSYLIAELGYDLTETSQDDLARGGKLPIWLRRPARWAWRRASWKTRV